MGFRISCTEFRIPQAKICWRLAVHPPGFRNKFSELDFKSENFKEEYITLNPSKQNNTIKETHRCILETFSFYFQTYIASLTNKPHWLCHVNKPQELSAKVLSLNWGRFSGSQSIVFSPDGHHLCCGTKSETGRTYYLTLWDVETGKCHVWFAVVY